MENCGSPERYSPNSTASETVESSMGEMSSIVSRRPSLRNQSKDSRWMSMRLGRSRTCLRRENEWRARGDVPVLAKENRLPYWLYMRGGAEKRACKGGRFRTSAQPPTIAEASLQPQ